MILGGVGELHPPLRWRFLRAAGRLLLGLLRAGFLLLLLVIPVPVGELFHKMLEGRRRAHAAKVVKRENPD